MELMVRCPNCLGRFALAPKVERATCTHCQKEWRISWPRPDQPRVRGPA